jgi:hypothetical protein
MTTPKLRSSLLLCICITASAPMATNAMTDTLLIDGHSFEYKIADAWRISERHSDSGYTTVILKRFPIIDKRNIRVIPNIMIKLVKVQLTDHTMSSNPDTSLFMFTGLSIMNFAPPEVYRDWGNPNNQVSKFRIPWQYSYTFNSPYRDSFFSRHVCLYLTAFDERRFGVLIIIDSTEEVFPLIESEVTAFLRSIRPSA